MCSACAGDYENPAATQGETDPMQEALQWAHAQLQMKVMCAWHPKNFGTEFVMREGTEPVSHGICDDCRERIGT